MCAEVTGRAPCRPILRRRRTRRIPQRAASVSVMVRRQMGGRRTDAEHCLRPHTRGLAKDFATAKPFKLDESDA